MSGHQVKKYNKPVGKLGNWVYYFVGEQYRKRAYVVPVQPATNPQKMVWRRFDRAVKSWQRQTTTVKAQYDVIGRMFRMSGFNYWIREQLLL